MDEVFETLTLMQTGKIEHFPIVAMGGDYWRHLTTFLDQTMVAHGTIDQSEREMVMGTDVVDEALAHIRKAAEQRRAAEPQRIPRPSWILGESKRK
jgi:hypothetical protein